MVEEKERKLTQEEKDFQINEVNRSLSELNFYEKDRLVKLSRVTKHIERGVPILEQKEFIDKHKKLLENGVDLEEKPLSEADKIKIEVEIELAEKELKDELPILRAKSEQSRLENELKQIRKNIKASLELLKKFR